MSNHEQVNPMSIMNDPLLFSSADFFRGLPITDFLSTTKPQDNQHIILPVEKEELISPMDLATFANNYSNFMIQNAASQAMEQQMPKEGTFIDITPYLLLPQHEGTFRYFVLTQ